MANNLQTPILIAFSLMEISEFQMKFCLNVFLRV